MYLQFVAIMGCLQNAQGSPKCPRLSLEGFLSSHNITVGETNYTTHPNTLNQKQALANRNHNIAMNALRKTIFQYRERFKRLDRKWHLLIGSQLFFGLAAFRYHRQQKRFELQQEIIPTTSTENSSSWACTNTQDKFEGRRRKVERIPMCSPLGRREETHIAKCYNGKCYNTKKEGMMTIVNHYTPSQKHDTTIAASKFIHAVCWADGSTSTTTRNFSYFY